MVRKITEETNISIPEVKEIMDEVIKKMEKLGKKPDTFQEVTFEYVNRFAKMPASAAKKIIKRLTTEFGMEPSLAIQVVNIDPRYIEELRIIFEKDPKLRNLPLEKLTQIIEIVKEEQA